jgi:opacity protein-like surface antigen
VPESATRNGGILASYRYVFKGNYGAEVTYGYGLNAQKYGLTTGLEGVSTRSSEISAAFVRRFVFKRWSPFLLAGASALVFDPNNVPAANTQTRVAFLYGGGTDFDLGRRIYMRAEYRCFVYTLPHVQPARTGWNKPALT